MMENRPLLSETPLLSQSETKNSSSRKTTILGLIAIIGIIVTFFAYNNGFGKKSHIHSNFVSTHDKLEKLKINLESIEFKPDLVAYEGQSVQLKEDPGTLEMETFTNAVIKGKMLLNEGNTLSFVFDSNSKYVSYQLAVTETDKVLHSFYSAKTADSNEWDLYSIDGKELNLDDKQQTTNAFTSFYASKLATSVVLLSMKVASMGYTGPMAASIRFIHSVAVHLVEMPHVADNLPSSYAENRVLLNKFFEESKRRLVEAEVLEEAEMSANPSKISSDWCLFWCDSDDCPGGTDGCPSYCYEVGWCVEEDKCDNECFGRCGDGCDCWSWVCGDCDCHCLCENHDYFCSCESTWEYECWSMWNWIDDDCD